MQGIEYLIDDKGEKTAVVINLKKWGELWEDIQDAIVYEERKNEKRIPWKEIKKLKNA